MLIALRNPDHLRGADGASRLSFRFPETPVLTQLLRGIEDLKDPLVQQLVINVAIGQPETSPNCNLFDNIAIIPKSTAETLTVSQAVKLVNMGANTYKKLTSLSDRAESAYSCFINS